MTAERRAAILAYCRIDELSDDEKPLFEGIYQAAVSYMEQAGISGPDEGTPRRGLYDLCVNALVLDSWDRRGTAVQDRGSFTTVENRSFRQMINQLKLTEPVSKLNTKRSWRDER